MAAAAVAIAVPATRHMHCFVTSTSREGEDPQPVRLLEARIYNIQPTEGENVTLVEYRVEGALVEAIPLEMEELADLAKLTCKKSTLLYGPDMPDILTLSPAVLTEDKLENLAKVKRIELWIGNCFIAVGDIDRETNVVRYTKERLTIPLASIPNVPIITNIYVDGDDTDPKICYQGGLVQPEDKDKVRKIKVNITFTYHGTNDINVLSVGGNKANTLHPRLVKSSNRICCLYSAAPPEKGKTLQFTPDGFERWLNRNYIHCPPLPLTHKTVEF